MNDGETFLRNEAGQEVVVRRGRVAFMAQNRRLAPRLLDDEPPLYRRMAIQEKRVAARRAALHQRIEERRKQRQELRKENLELPVLGGTLGPDVVDIRTFAKTGMPNSRSVQFFINYGNNANLDRMGFTPIGKVLTGMESTVDKINTEYGEVDYMRAEDARQAINRAKWIMFEYVMKETV